MGQNNYNFPAGFIRVSDEPTQLFNDPLAVVGATPPPALTGALHLLTVSIAPSKGS